MKISSIAAAILALGLSFSAQAASIVYNNDFSTSAGSEWSNNSIATSNGEKFLGASASGFGNGTDTLTLTGLAAHTSVTVIFDLYIIQSWDGNGPNGGGADFWKLLANGNTLINTSFANYTGGNTQDFGGSNGSGGYLTGGTYAPRTGESAAGHLGYGAGDFGDATYSFIFTFSDSNSSLALAFTSLQNQSPGDEGWGIDNVVVSTNADRITSPVPVPAAVWQGSSVLLLMAGAQWLRRRVATRVA